MPAPGIAGSVGPREAFVRDPHVAEVMRKARSANLAFMGIGEHPDGTPSLLRKVKSWRGKNSPRSKSEAQWETLTYAILMDEVNVFLPT